MHRFWREPLGLLGATLAVWSSVAGAADPVVLTDTTMPYQHVEDDDHDDSCDWRGATLRYLVKESEGAVVSGTTSDRRRQLTLTVQTLHILGGGVWTGPKWLVLEGRLTDHGKLVGSFEARRQSYRGSLGYCGTVKDFGEAISDDVIEWLKQPTLDARLGDAR